MVAWPGVRLLAARVDGEIVGALTLVMFRFPPAESVDRGAGERDGEEGGVVGGEPG
jgi:hypothetical protein